MKMYLVVRYVDELPENEYGVDDSYYAIGLFSSEEKANFVKETAIAAITPDCRSAITIIPIEVNRIYAREEQIFLGGGFYIE